MGAENLGVPDENEPCSPCLSKGKVTPDILSLFIHDMLSCGPEFYYF